MKKEKIFLTLMFLLNVVLIIWGLVIKNYISAMTLIPLAIYWGYKLYKLKE